MPASSSWLLRLSLQLFCMFVFLCLPKSEYFLERNENLTASFVCVCAEQSRRQCVTPQRHSSWLQQVEQKSVAFGGVREMNQISDHVSD